MSKVCLVMAMVSGGLLSGATPSQVPPVAAKCLGLFQELRDAEAQKGAGKARHVSFRLSSNEINDYMRWALANSPRPGLNSVTVKVFPYDYVSTFAIVDFDAVEKWKPGTIPMLLRPMLSGKRTIWVDYRFRADNGRMTFSVEKAYYGSVRLPAFFVQEMIKIMAARQPEHYDTSRPLPIPFGLRKVWTEGQAVAGEN